MEGGPKVFRGSALNPNGFRASVAFVGLRAWGKAVRGGCNTFAYLLLKPQKIERFQKFQKPYGTLSLQCQSGHLSPGRCQQAAAPGLQWLQAVLAASEYFRDVG